jgi:hypothetical protein
VEAASVTATYVVDRVPGRPRAVAPPGAKGRLPKYTREQIVDAIRRWTELHGAPPTRADWEPSRARRMGHDWRVRRFEQGEWPTTRMVCRWFGTFNVAIEEAGFEPRRAPSRVRTQLSGPDAILAAIREWVRRYGDVPTQADWDPFRARRLGHEWRVVRYRQGDWPSLQTVLYNFGSLSEAIRRAELQPRTPHQSVHDVRAAGRENRSVVTVHDARRRSEAGVEELGHALCELACARRAHDPEATRKALLEVAATALAWAEEPVD